MRNYTEEIKVATKRGEISLGPEYGKKPVIVRTYEDGIIQIIPAEVKPLINKDEVKDALKRFKKDHAEANRILKHD
jgi:hypothetical protein